MNIYSYFILFVIYSVFGWLLEVTNTIVRSKKFVNRGFLIGPYCPIYGVGGLLSFVLLRKYINNIFLLFIMSIILFTILEYFTSYIMEKLFHARWWDYSNKKYNINGRVCLETMLLFGIIGVIFMYLINPFLIKVLITIPQDISRVISIVLFIIMFTDFIISFNIINNFKKLTFNLKTDSTEDITKKVRYTLSEGSVLNKRLVKAFNRLKVRNGENNEKE